MAYQDTVKYIELTGNPATDFPSGIDVTDAFVEYYINGMGATAGNNYGILPVGTPRVGTRIVFRFIPTFVKGGWLFEIFGNTISDNQLLNGFVAEGFWDGTQWGFQFTPNLQYGLALGSIETDNIVDQAVTTPKIANDAVTTAKILDQNVTTAKLADDAVTTVKILNLNVTNNKIANADIIGYDKLVANSVQNAQLAQMNAYTIKGNDTGVLANATDIPISTLFGTYAWKLTGNSGTDGGVTNFIGTTDDTDLVFKLGLVPTQWGKLSFSDGNISFGNSALVTNTIGTHNIALGNQALTSNTTGVSNIGIGDNSLAANIGGIDNVGVGIRTLENNLANRNVAVGTYALQDNDLGNNNVAIGYNAGANIIGGGADNNVAVGYLAGATLNGGNSNTLIGAGADVDSGAAINRIALGAAIATADNQFALPNTVTDWKIRGNNFTLPSADGAANAVLQTDGSGVLSFGSIVDSGTYTPTLTNVANVTSSAAFVCQWMRVGSVVTVSGKVDIELSAPATPTELGVTLPIASNFASEEQCGGTSLSEANATSIRILADSVNNRASFQANGGTATNDSYSFIFTYSII